MGLFFSVMVSKRSIHAFDQAKYYTNRLISLNIFHNFFRNVPYSGSYFLDEYLAVILRFENVLFIQRPNHKRKSSLWHHRALTDTSILKNISRLLLIITIVGKHARTRAHSHCNACSIDPTFRKWSLNIVRLFKYQRNPQNTKPVSAQNWRDAICSVKTHTMGVNSSRHCIEFNSALYLKMKY